MTRLKRLSELTVRNIDSGRDATPTERQNVERSEIRLEILVCLESGRPREQRKERFSSCHQRSKLGRHDPVDDGYKSFKLSSHTGRIAISFNETNVSI